jgi:hypothetical protein
MFRTGESVTRHAEALRGQRRVWAISGCGPAKQGQRQLGFLSDQPRLAMLGREPPDRAPHASALATTRLGIEAVVCAPPLALGAGVTPPM